LCNGGGITVAELNVREWYAYNTKKDANKCFSISFANKNGESEQEFMAKREHSLNERERREEKLKD
jgi:hypothetical protein